MKTFVNWLEQNHPGLFSAIKIIKEPKDKNSKKKPNIKHDGWKIIK
jgi:hypothetical protein